MSTQCYIRDKEYDGGSRGGHRCLCGRQIRVVVEVILKKNGLVSRKVAKLGTECAESINSERVQKLLDEFFGDNPDMVEPPPLPF